MIIEPGWPKPDLNHTLAIGMVCLHCEQTVNNACLICSLDQGSPLWSTQQFRQALLTVAITLFSPWYIYFYYDINSSPGPQELHRHHRRVWHSARHLQAEWHHQQHTETQVSSGASSHLSMGRWVCPHFAVFIVVCDVIGSEINTNRTKRHVVVVHPIIISKARTFFVSEFVLFRMLKKSG